MIDGILIICALTYVAPYYDCSEQWTIHYFDNLTTLNCEKLGIRAVSCASWGLNRIELFLPLSNIPLDDGKTPLQHVLEHLKCKCNFHPEMPGYALPKLV